MQTLKVHFHASFLYKIVFGTTSYYLSKLYKTIYIVIQNISHPSMKIDVFRIKGLIHDFATFYRNDTEDGKFKWFDDGGYAPFLC